MKIEENNYGLLMNVQEKEKKIFGRMKKQK